MPKRDNEYMNAQREAIAGAALNVLLEKGVSRTSLRDICKEASVSMGGLYTHFANKDEVIVAACSLDYIRQRQEAALPASWDDYVRFGFEPDMFKEARRAKRFRLSLQFVAELTQLDHNPAGLNSVYHLYIGTIARNLEELRRRGIIALPHGLELTSIMHMQIFSGAAYHVAANKDLPLAVAKEAVNNSLAATAGLIDSANVKAE